MEPQKNNTSNTDTTSKNDVIIDILNWAIEKNEIELLRAKDYDKKAALRYKLDDQRNDLNFRKQIKRRLDFEIEETRSNPKNERFPAQLEVNLSDTQRDILYMELVSGRFITPGDKESFIYVFGGKNPETFTKIYWKFSNNTLFELLEALTGTVSNKNLERCKSLFSTKKGLTKKVSRPKKIRGDGRQYSEYIKEIETIKGKLFPTT